MIRNCPLFEDLVAPTLGTNISVRDSIITVDRNQLSSYTKIKKTVETRMHLLPRFTQPLQRRHPTGTGGPTRIYFRWA